MTGQPVLATCMSKEDQWGMENVEFCTLAATVSKTVQATRSI